MVRIGLGPLLRALTVLALVALMGMLVAPSALAAAPRHFHKTSPANDATGRSSAPTLRWGASAGAKSYRYCIDRSDNSRCNTTWVSTHAKRSARLNGLKRGATYYWQVKAVNSHASVTADRGRWFSFKVSATAPKLPTPHAGHWTVSLPATGGSGAAGSIDITGADFAVASDHSAVSSFGFDYTYSGVSLGGSCSGAGSSTESARSPITKDQFSTPAETGPWTGAGSATFRGTFTTTTEAHGSATFEVFIEGPNCEFSGSVSTGKVTWSAKAS
jgi:hypothetical protein